MNAQASKWSTKPIPERIDWPAVRDRIDLAPVATALMGPAPGRRGERGRRLWWSCPFHEDANPSFCVDPGKPYWRCFGCGERGDVANLVMRLQGISFPAAVRMLADQTGLVIAAPVRARPLGRGPNAGIERPSALSMDEATALIDSASGLLWGPGGREGLAYLRNRGLQDDTIKAARLGWADKLRVPNKDGSGTWPLSGVVVPWLDRDRPALLKVRRLGFLRGSKYIEVFRDSPILYPNRGIMQPGCTAIVCEGEFDALLLQQEVGHLGVSVVTLGGASNRPPPEAVDLLCMASRLFIATDADSAGDAAASTWPAHARRVRPPAGSKDWTEVHQGGRNRLRYLWPGILCDHDWPRARGAS